MSDKKQMGVGDSEFHMWRAIFAMAHADEIVTEEERKFLTKALTTISFSDAQRHVLLMDLVTPQNIAGMFAQISDPKDRSQFFYFARMLLWCDGDFARQEQKILTELAKTHYKSVDFDKMMTAVNMELEDGAHKAWIAEDMGNDGAAADLPGVMSRFLDRFRK